MAETWRYDLIRAVLGAAGAVLRESEQLFRPHGLTAAQYNVLSALAPHPGGITQRELGDVLVVDRSNVTGLLDRMSRAGWVERRDDPADRRAYRVVLTRSGRHLWTTVAHAYADALSRVTDGFAEQRVRQVVRSLEQLQTQASRWRDGSTAAPGGSRPSRRRAPAAVR